MVWGGGGEEGEGGGWGERGMVGERGGMVPNHDQWLSSLYGFHKHWYDNCWRKSFSFQRNLF